MASALLCLVFETMKIRRGQDGERPGGRGPTLIKRMGSRLQSSGDNMTATASPSVQDR